MIINGAMFVDQRNSANTAVTTNGYATDRWYVENGCDAVLSAQQTTDVPAGQGFINSLRVTSTTPDATIASNQFAVITQHIEGFNSAQLAWGTSQAKPIVVSFWVKADVVGTYSFTVYNNGASRICPSSYTINSPNTWEKKTIFVNGETTGTWLTNNLRGVVVNFYTALGSQFLGASGVWNSSGIYGVTGQANAWASTNNRFFITGVQLEQNYQPTPFEQRPYGVELALCQRYYQRRQGGSIFGYLSEPGPAQTSANGYPVYIPKVPFRSSPSAAPEFSNVGASDIYNAISAVTAISILANYTNENFVQLQITSSGLTVGRIYWLCANNAVAHLGISAEL